MCGQVLRGSYPHGSAKLNGNTRTARFECWLFCAAPQCPTPLSLEAPAVAAVAAAHGDSDVDSVDSGSEGPGMDGTAESSLSDGESSGVVDGSSSSLADDDSCHRGGDNDGDGGDGDDDGEHEEEEKREGEGEEADEAEQEEQDEEDDGDDDDPCKYDDRGYKVGGENEFMANGGQRALATAPGHARRS